MASDAPTFDDLALDCAADLERDAWSHGVIRPRDISAWKGLCALAGQLLISRAATELYGCTLAEAKEFVRACDTLETGLGLLGIEQVGRTMLWTSFLFVRDFADGLLDTMVTAQ